MRPIYGLALALLLIPAAAAQSPGFTPTLEIAVDAPSSTNETSAPAVVTATLYCPFTTPDPTQTYTLEVGMMVDHKLVYVSGASTKVVSNACFSLVPGLPMAHVVEWELSIDASELNETALVLFETEVWAESEGSPIYREPSDAMAEFAVTFEKPAPLEDEKPLENEIPAEETTPGLAVPLLGATLLGLAGRRQA